MMRSPRVRVPGELAFVLLLLGASLFLLWATHGISGLASFTSAGSFPMAAAATMVVCGVVIAINTRRAAEEAPQAGEGRIAHARRRVLPRVVVWMLVVLLTYMVGMERIGFILASYLFLVISMRLLGERRWLLNLTVSALALAVIYFIFRVAFSVFLPTGTLWTGLFS